MRLPRAPARAAQARAPLPGSSRSGPAAARRRRTTSRDATPRWRGGSSRERSGARRTGARRGGEPGARHPRRRAGRAGAGHRALPLGRRLPRDALPSRSALAAERARLPRAARPRLERVRRLDHGRRARRSLGTASVRRRRRCGQLRGGGRRADTQDGRRDGRQARDPARRRCFRGAWRTASSARTSATCSAT